MKIVYNVTEKDSEGFQWKYVNGLLSYTHSLYDGSWRDTNKPASELIRTRIEAGRIADAKILMDLIANPVSETPDVGEKLVEALRNSNGMSVGFDDDDYEYIIHLYFRKLGDSTRFYNAVDEAFRYNRENPSK